MKDKKINKYYNQKKNLNKRNIIIIGLIAILLIILVIIFIKINNKTAKNSKIGKNSSSQEIVDYILNISSYETEIEAEVKSNKNSNKYKIKQKYIEGETNTQEIMEPNNIQGVKIIKEGNNLRIENTRLSLSKIIENYNELTQNNIDLINFIDNYKSNSNSRFEEKDNQIIMETTATHTENNYQKYETLYVSRENGKPEKLEIKDTNQNTTIYIIYNKIKINEKLNGKIYAFKIYNTLLEI